VLLWIILACLTALVLLVLLRPLAAGGGAAPERPAFDATVYRDQLNEVENDRARGLIGDAEAEAARVEIARRLLAADSAESKEGRSALAPARGATARVATIGIAAFLPLLTIGLYLAYGSPRLPDQPLAARLNGPASDQNLGALVARVEARLRAHPEEGQGWDVIAPVYLGAQRFADAADAYNQAIRLLGPSAARLSGLGQALVLQNNGVVTEEARRALEAALESDGTLVEPRVLLAIAKEQDGNFAAAIEDWKGLLATPSANDQWRQMIKTRIAEAEAHAAGRPVARAGGAGGGKGPTAEDVAAAETMSPAERQAMIEGMVGKLAARLNQQGDDLPGWLKLVRAYSVLDRKDDAAKALARAKTQFSGNSQALDQLERLAAELGLKS
jgi:cytochrome c-type biogenesis protein CcmH